MCDKVPKNKAAISQPRFANVFLDNVEAYTLIFPLTFDLSLSCNFLSLTTRENNCSGTIYRISLHSHWREIYGAQLFLRAGAHGLSHSSEDV